MQGLASCIQTQKEGALEVSFVWWWTMGQNVTVCSDGSKGRSDYVGLPCWRIQIHGSHLKSWEHCGTEIYSGMQSCQENTRPMHSGVERAYLVLPVRGVGQNITSISATFTGMAKPGKSFCTYYNHLVKMKSLQSKMSLKHAYCICLMWQFNVQSLR